MCSYGVDSKEYGKLSNLHYFKAIVVIYAAIKKIFSEFTDTIPISLILIRAITNKKKSL